MTKYGRSFGYKQSTFGSDTAGHDVKAYGDTTGKYAEWDASADQFNVVGTNAITGNQTVSGRQSVGGVQTLTTGQYIKGSRFQVTYPDVAAADVAKTFFIAPTACKIVSAYERHVTVAGQAGSLTIEKLTTGEAPSAGDVLITTGWDLTSTANTPVLKTAVTTAAGTLPQEMHYVLNLQVAQLHHTHLAQSQ